MPGLPREPSLDEVSSSSDSGKENATFATNAPSGKSPNKPNHASHVSDPFSIEGVDKLESFIDMDYLPDILIVHDKHNITNRGSYKPRYYARAYPKAPENPQRKLRSGTLHLDSLNIVSNGRRASVHRAPLVATLAAPGEPRKRVVVAVKTPNDNCRAHHLLHEEAKGYAAFPREFYNECTPIPAGAPLRKHRAALQPRRAFPGWGVAMSPKSSSSGETAPPIVPKFYGFYLPINSKGKCVARAHQECNDFANACCDVPHWAKPILLMEDCGEEVDPEALSTEQREHCLELVERMHRQGFSHGHPLASNMLIQPGPLSVPISLRSMDTPSFRLISFGRWRGYGHVLPLETELGAKRAFEEGRASDVTRAMHDLGLITLD